MSQCNNINIKISSNKRIDTALLLSFLSGWPCDYRQNAAGTLNANFTPAYLKGWTYVRTDDFVQNQHFLDT